ncbi:hypothetical protein QW180_30965 [Vibrio sinaloensis]|nr:hypothetical protein [Vibrio sinaloensis]
MTLGNSPYQRHTVGHAKSLGAGTIELNIIEQQCLLKANNDKSNTSLQVAELVEQFQQHMNKQYPKQGKWLESAQISHLLALTDEDIEKLQRFFVTCSWRIFKHVKKTAVDSLPSIEHNGQSLSRVDNVVEDQGSSAFGKGRLSALLTGSEFESNQLHLAKQFVAKQQKKAAEKKQNSQKRNPH